MDNLLRFYLICHVPLTVGSSFEETGPSEFTGAPSDEGDVYRMTINQKLGLATKSVDYIHEPVRMHYVLDSLQQLCVPDVLVVRVVAETVNHLCRQTFIFKDIKAVLLAFCVYLIIRGRDRL